VRQPCEAEAGDEKVVVELVGVVHSESDGESVGHAVTEYCEHVAAVCVAAGCVEIGSDGRRCAQDPRPVTVVVEFDEGEWQFDIMQQFVAVEEGVIGAEQGGFVLQAEGEGVLFAEFFIVERGAEEDDLLLDGFVAVVEGSFFGIVVFC